MKNKSFNIVVWHSYSSQVTFREIANSFLQYLSVHHKCMRTDRFDSDPAVTNIVFGANEMAFGYRKTIPQNSILVNLEQMGEEQPWANTAYISMLRRFPVWDYSTSNIQYLQSKGVENITQFKVGYTPNLESSAVKYDVEKDIDVLFYGALNERRIAIRDALTLRGVNAIFVNNVFGVERDRLIARSKIVLNIHYYNSKILEVIRLSHLLANRKCVISERGSDSDVNRVWKKGVVMCNYEEIVDKTVDYLDNHERRAAQEQHAYVFMQKHPLELPI